MHHPSTRLQSWWSGALALVWWLWLWLLWWLWGAFRRSKSLACDLHAIEIASKMQGGLQSKSEARTTLWGKPKSQARWCTTKEHSTKQELQMLSRPPNDVPCTLYVQVLHKPSIPPRTYKLREYWPYLSLHLSQARSTFKVDHKWTNPLVCFFGEEFCIFSSEKLDVSNVSCPYVLVRPKKDGKMQWIVIHFAGSHQSCSVHGISLPFQTFWSLPKKSLYKCSWRFLAVGSSLNNL